MKDYYDILGVDEDASQKEIKEAYRKLAKEHHPDSKNGDTEKFQEINKAYKTLKDEESRAKYDRKRQYGGGSGKKRRGRGSFGGGEPFGKDSFGASGPSWTQVDFDLGDKGGQRMSMEDIFDEFTKKRRRHQKKGTTSAPSQRSLKIVLPFEESLTETKRRIDIDGRMKKITIPGGVYSGWTKKIDKQKNVVLMVDVEDPPKNEFYKRKRLDLYKRIKLNVFRAVTGVKIRITNVYNQKIEVKIPKGTEPGELFKISDEGIKFKSEKGDMFLKVDYHIPELNDEECEELKSFMNRRSKSGRDKKYDLN